MQVVVALRLPCTIAIHFVSSVRVVRDGTTTTTWYRFLFEAKGCEVRDVSSSCYFLKCAIFVSPVPLFALRQYLLPKEVSNPATGPERAWTWTLHPGFATRTQVALIASETLLNFLASADQIQAPSVTSFQRPPQTRRGVQTGSRSCLASCSKPVFLVLFGPSQPVLFGRSSATACRNSLPALAAASDSAFGKLLEVRSILRTRSSGILRSVMTRM
mmetsp:Transcript_13585/g.33397  ORF Transcript_13585/g.33397 Transcript_13585/m.33397 type:complete len:216 (-) Transcript_13585:2263-2910(-)